MLDNRGQPLLSPLSLRLHAAGRGRGDRPQWRRARDARPHSRAAGDKSYSGRVLIDSECAGPDVGGAREPHDRLCRHETEIIAGTLRDNILLPLKRRRPDEGRPARSRQEEHHRFIEAIRSGNTPFAFTADWTDYEGWASAMRFELAAHVHELLDVLRLHRGHLRARPRRQGDWPVCEQRQGADHHWLAGRSRKSSRAASCRA
jgi:putative ABC transport system ATP-binding protein